MPNDHQGPPDVLLVWPEQRYAPWQSPGPNELISQLEALDGGAGATLGKLGGQRERKKRSQPVDLTAKYEEDAGEVLT